MHEVAKNRAFLLSAGLLVFLAMGCSPASEDSIGPESQQAERSAAVSPTPSAVVDGLRRGIDVSVHSGEIDWSVVTQHGFDFVILKASEGVDLPDPSYRQHWQALSDHDVIRGAYHFYVTEDDPDAQADLFVETVTLESGDLAPIVDIELIGHNTPPGLETRLKRFLDRLEGAFGVKPILYTNPHFWDQHLSPDFGAYPLWVAEYDVESPMIPEGWDDYHLWQYAGDAQVPGITAGADLSRTHPEQSRWNDLLIPDRDSSS